ncbi:hypothetical protein COLO4_36531 [Corchorus olitorius]|uniref:Uncharacterized protein n=1 Tax=Corchorus olitorius TaxID=93759 RepID=A0A1R3G868_9ROSI|nr:hypothetical protein COLO4_36531 [Corchorus olitorius]
MSWQENFFLKNALDTRWHCILKSGDNDLPCLLNSALRFVLRDSMINSASLLELAAIWTLS